MDNLKTKEDLDKEKQEDRVSKNFDFMNKSDEDYQKELDEYAQFPQFKYQQEMFAKQYDDPDKELSRAAKTYSVLHNARSGMEALPAVAGSEIVSLAATPVVAGILSAAGTRPLARVHNPGGILKNVWYEDEFGNKYKTEQDFFNAKRYAQLKKYDQHTELVGGSKAIYPDIPHVTTAKVPEYTTTKPVLYQNYNNPSVYDRNGKVVYRSIDQSNLGTFKKNETDLKNTVEDLTDDRPFDSSKPTYTTVGKQLSMQHPRIANAISNAIKIAKGLGDAATSYGIGAAINKGDDNYNDTLARKYTRDYFYDLPSDSRKKIKEEGLNEEIFNEYVAPFIKFTESNKYAIDEPTLTDMLKNKKFDELKLQYGIDATDWQNADKKTKKKLENYWLTAKNRKRAFEEGR